MIKIILTLVGFLPIAWANHIDLSPGSAPVTIRANEDTTVTCGALELSKFLPVCTIQRVGENYLSHAVYAIHIDGKKFSSNSLHIETLIKEMDRLKKAGICR